MARRLLRDVVVEALARLPLSVKTFMIRRCRRALLWVLFHLESERITIARVGPSLCRYLMWLNWQGGTDYVLGTYEPRAVEALRRYVKRRQFCIDVGAHLGYYAILMARFVQADGMVVAFEPFPGNFEGLKKMLN